MKLIKLPILFCIGGIIYNLIELLYRQYTHWTMFIVGGLCFIFLGLLNEILPWEMSIIKQMTIGSIVITLIEFISGCIINLVLGWNVWDYSEVPFNILGQVCIPFMVIWFFISLIGIILDDYLRYWLFKEEKPHYKIK